MYQKPSVNVYQDFQVQATVETSPMPTVIIGPRNDFLDLNNSEDKSNAYVGDYDKTTDKTYPYPQKSAISEVNQDSVKIYLDDARLKYYSKVAGAGSQEFRVVTKARNWITTVAPLESERLSFQEYTNSAGTKYDRSLEFDNRDVKVGDIISIKGVISGTEYSKTSKVKSFRNNIIDSSIDQPTADENNHVAQAYSATITEGNLAGHDQLAISGTYIGSLKDNVLSDIYTVTVTAEGGNADIKNPNKTVNNGGNTATSGGYFDNSQRDVYTVSVLTGGAPGVAKLRVTSLLNDDNESIDFSAFATNINIGSKGVWINIANDGSVSGELVEGDTWEIEVIPSTGKLSIYSDSGKDDIANKTFPGFGVAFDCGSFGLKITITDDSADGKINLNDQWKIEAKKQLAIPLIYTTGTYDYTKDITYTVEVTQGGLFGEAEITVTSSEIDASGPSVISNHDVNVAAGTKGALVYFEDNVQGGLIKGDRWVFKANSQKNGAVKTIILEENLPNEIINAYGILGSLTKTATGGDTTATSSGNYSDIKNALSTVEQEKYTIEITEAGQPGVDTPKFKVTSESGLDDQGDTLIAAYDTDYNLGSCGLKISFHAGATPDHPAIGDKWEIAVDGNNLSADFMLSKNMELPKQKEDIPQENAYDVTKDNVTIKAGLNLSDSSWKSGNEVLPLEYAKIYIGYTAIRIAESNEILFISSKSDIEKNIGKISLYNPIAYAVDKALDNNPNGIYCYPITSDDVSGHQKFLTLAEKAEFAYSLVPLSYDKDIRDLYLAHINKFSVPEFGKWRIGLFSVQSSNIDTLYDVWYNAGDPTPQDYLATITDYINTPETDYIFVEATNGGVDFLAKGVKEGDILRTHYHIDNLGNTVYDSYPIAGVLSKTTLLLSTAASSPSLTPEKYTIIRNLDASGKIEKLGTISTSIKNRRACLVYPDTLIDDNNIEVPGYYLCAAISALKSAKVPHQGLTNYTISGFKSVPKTYIDMNEEELNKLASYGYMIITQDDNNSSIYIRHQLTSNMDYLEYKELSITTNIDNISFYLRNILKPLLGKYNINDDTLDLIRTDLEAGIENLKSVSDKQAGQQLIDAKIDKLYQDENLKDQVRVDLILTIPYPMNTINVHLII